MSGSNVPVQPDDGLSLDVDIDLKHDGGFSLDAARQHMAAEFLAHAILNSVAQAGSQRATLIKRLLGAKTFVIQFTLHEHKPS